MKQLFIKLWNFIPKFALLPVLCIFIYQSTVYFGTKLINHNFYHYDLTTGLDNITPLIAWFSIIYVGCYVFWAINYILVGKITKEHFYKFATSIFISYTLCGIIFVIFPTSINRPDITVNSFSDMVMNYVYSSDTPVNLFPSMHCLISWFCYIGIRNCKEICISYRIFSLIMAILVCISTVTIKQHFIVDIFAGIIIAEAVYYLVKRSNVWNPIYNFFEKLNAKLHLS